MTTLFDYPKRNNKLDRSKTKQKKKPIFVTNHSNMLSLVVMLWDPRTLTLFALSISRTLTVLALSLFLFPHSLPSAVGSLITHYFLLAPLYLVTLFFKLLVDKRYKFRAPFNLFSQKIQRWIFCSIFRFYLDFWPSRWPPKTSHNATPASTSQDCAITSPSTENVSLGSCRSARRSRSLTMNCAVRPSSAWV